MRWEAQWAGKIDFLLTLKDQGLDPEPLKNRPQREQEFNWLFEAYSLLTRSRQIGMSEFYIPMSEFLAYLDIMKIESVEERSFLVNVISKVDLILLNERFEKDRQKMNQ